MDKKVMCVALAQIIVAWSGKTDNGVSEVLDGIIAECERMFGIEYDAPNTIPTSAIKPIKPLKDF